MLRFVNNAALWHPRAVRISDMEFAYKTASGKDWDPLAVFADAVKALKAKSCAKPS